MLSGLLRRGFVRMQRICYGLRTITGFDRPFSARTGLIDTNVDCMKRSELEEAILQQHLQEDPSIISERRSTYRSHIPKIKHG